jgi:beta-glucanase (GH16 family)
MEAAAYGDSTRNVRVEDGKLKLLVTNDESGVDPNFPVISGKVTSKHQFGLLYGTVEASIRFPENCQGLWPAFWLLPRDDKYGKWPLSGEIDIFEAKNNMDDGATCAIHFPGGLKRGFTTLGDPRQFHKFRLEWSAGLIQYYFDDELYFEAKENWNVSEVSARFGAPLNSAHPSHPPYSGSERRCYARSLQ